LEQPENKNKNVMKERLAKWRVLLQPSLSNLKDQNSSMGAMPGSEDPMGGGSSGMPSMVNMSMSML